MKRSYPETLPYRKSSGPFHRDNFTRYKGRFRKTGRGEGVTITFDEAIWDDDKTWFDYNNWDESPKFRDT